MSTLPDVDHCCLHKRCLFSACLNFDSTLLFSQDHNKQSESEAARVVREGGDATNLSVAVTRAFGDVDISRFAEYWPCVGAHALTLSDLQFFCKRVFAIIGH